jgi:polar amino acid transport system substrate-binding protein
MLRKDEVHAVVADYEICALSVLRYPDDGLVTLSRPLTVEPLGIAVAPGDPLFLNLIENNVAALEASGLFEGLRGRWFKSGGWVDELP